MVSGRARDRTEENVANSDSNVDGNGDGDVRAQCTWFGYDNANGNGSGKMCTLTANLIKYTKCKFCIDITHTHKI